MASAFASKWLDWTPKTPSQQTDSTDSFGGECGKNAVNGGFGDDAKKAWSLPETPDQRTDTPDSLQSVSTVSLLNRRLETTKLPPPHPLLESIREQFEERAAIAEFDGGLSRTEAELLAWDEIRTCAQCHRETQGEADAVRVSGGGWLHLDGCYDGYFGFRQGQQS